MLQLKMLSYLNFVLLHIILFSTKTTGSNICRVSFPVTDHILTGHVIRTLQYKTFESCTFSCELEPRCFSVNYLHGTCQLNNATVVYFPEDVVKQKGAIYIEMVIRCVTGFSGLRCEKPACISKPLGMEDGSIANNQLTASSTHSNGKVAWGRLRCSEGSWTPISVSSGAWFQVNFAPKRKLITHIATQGNGRNWWWVKTYYVMYGTGRVVSEEYKEHNQRRIFPGNTNKDKVVKNKINNPFKGDTVRIIAQAYYGMVALRIELYGCDVI